MVRVVVALFVALLVGLSHQRGTIYLNEIQPIPDAISGVTQIPIECTLWDETTVYLDTFNGIPAPGTGGGSGVEVDGVLIDGFSWVFPNELVVGNNVKMAGLLQIDGGFFADDGDSGDANGDGLDFAFTIADNSGDTTIAGTLDILGGLNNQDDITNPKSTFTVEAGSGRTTIEGLTSPNGGINVLNDIFYVLDSGFVFGEGDLSVEQDLFFGNDRSSRAMFEHYSNAFLPTPEFGGDLTLKGQDGGVIGGNIVISPGFSTGASIAALPGSIFMGIRLKNYDLDVSRLPTDSGNGGKLVVLGQRSSADGGTVEIRAGSSNEGTGSGGDLVLDPGFNVNVGTANPANGRLILGNPQDGPNIPFIMRRPNVADSDNAGDTSFYAQDTFDARGGDLILRAGSGSQQGGQIHLEPGTNGPIEGKIIFGNIGVTVPENIFIRRATDPNNIGGAPTYIAGQDSTGGDGGDLFIIAGDGSDTESGNLFLSPGLRADGSGTGSIWWGNNANNADLYVLRPPTQTEAGQETALIGQSSGDEGLFPGGDIVITGGEGTTFGGDLYLYAGNGEKEYGGSIYLTSTFASTATVGGDIEILAGDGAENGGDIFIFAGDSGYDDIEAGNFISLGGDIFIAAGAGSVAQGGGDVQFTTASAFYLDAVPFFIEAQGNSDNSLIITNTIGPVTNQLELFPTAAIAGLFHLTSSNGIDSELLTARQSITATTFPQTSDPYEPGNWVNTVIALQQAMNDLLVALSNHQLVEVDQRPVGELPPGVV